MIEEATPVGRLDIHYASPVVHATLVVSESLTQEGIQDIVEMIDEDLIDAVGIDSVELIVQVRQGRDLGVFAHHGWPRGDGNTEEEGA